MGDVYSPKFGWVSVPTKPTQNTSGRRSGGGSTRYTVKTQKEADKATELTKTVEAIVEGALVRLLGDQTGVSGFVLGNIKSTAASALSGTQVDCSIVDQNGATYYFTCYPTKA